MAKINKFVSRRLKIIFLGTPEFVLPVLDALKKEHEVLAVVTQPPKPVGRKQILTPSPVARWAKQRKIKVLTDLRNLPPSDVGVLAAYGKIIPEEVIQHFPHGVINIHPSLLPKYRGASPVQGAIAAGEKETGATIIRLDKEMDHGPILAQFTQKIKSDDTTGTLRDRLFKEAAETLITILPKYLEGKVELREQNHDQATYTRIIKKEHGFIPGKYLEAALRGETVEGEWSIPFIKNYTLTPTPYSLARLTRALSPWPGAWTKVGSRTKGIGIGYREARLKLLRAHLEPLDPKRYPLKHKLVLDQVQLEGKNPVSWEQFKSGYPKMRLEMH